MKTLWAVIALVAATGFDAQAANFNAATRNVGSIVRGTGEIVSAPLRLSPRALLHGCGRLATGAVGIALSPFAGPDLDLSRFAPSVNSALEYLDRSSSRGRIFPVGSRVRTWNGALLWTIPGRGQVMQSAQVSPSFRWACALVHQRYIAQERAFGFVVPDARDWIGPPNPRQDIQCTVTILHEFYHQEIEIDGWFEGWSPAYWGAYVAAYPLQGYNNHWAESAAKNGAYVVDRALSGPQPR